MFRREWWNGNVALEYVELGILLGFLVALSYGPSVSLTLTCFAGIAISPLFGFFFLWLRYDVFKRPFRSAGLRISDVILEKINSGESTSGDDRLFRREWWNGNVALEYVELSILLGFLIALCYEPSIGLTVTCIAGIAVSPLFGFFFLWLQYDVFKRPFRGVGHHISETILEASKVSKGDETISITVSSSNANNNR